MNNLRAIMADEAHLQGAITFARFMELALYCPNFGYYERPETTVGRSGDFFTSASVGSLFGELLAVQFAEWLGTLLSSGQQGPGQIQIVEAGAHDGRLAGDILSWLRSNRPRLVESLEYWIIEPSDSRTRMQRKALAGLGSPLRWFSTLSAIPPSGVNGIIFSNELLDAMPVHRIGWDAAKREWFEWAVAPADQQYGVPPSGGNVSAPTNAPHHVPMPDSLSPSEGERAGVRGPIAPAAAAALFTWTKLPADPSILRRGGLSNLPKELLAVLPDGFTTEIGLAAMDWWREAAGTLRSGKLITIDYGLLADEFLQPERSQGTLRAYRRHQVTSDLLASPGEQDLTAHVNFTAIQQAGEALGLLRTDAFQSQAQFLTAILQGIQRDPADFGEWTPKHARQFQTLAHPAHLGRPFRVLVQSR